MRFLLVDDDEPIRRLERRVLASIGHTDCIEAADGVEALEAIRVHSPDVVLLDLDMPRLGGLAVLDRIRAGATDRGPLVLVVSGRAPPRRTAADGVLAKPFSPDDLAGAIHGVVGRPNPGVLEVADDSGFLALLDPDAYESYVRQDWTLEVLLDHFRRQMAARRLLIWGTGLEGTWRVAWGGEPARRPHREIAGPIASTRGRLLLTSYEELTTAAMFRHLRLPGPHQRDLLVAVEPGLHTARVRQLFDREGALDVRGPDFSIALEPPGDFATWRRIPWWNG